MSARRSQLHFQRWCWALPVLCGSGQWGKSVPKNTPRGEWAVRPASPCIISCLMWAAQRNCHCPAPKESEMETEEEVDILMSSDVYSATLSTKSISFSRSQIGWLFREDKTVSFMGQLSTRATESEKRKTWLSIFSQGLFFKEFTEWFMGSIITNWAWLILSFWGRY